MPFGQERKGRAWSKHSKKVYPDYLLHAIKFTVSERFEINHRDWLRVHAFHRSLAPLTVRSAAVITLNVLDLETSKNVQPEKLRSLASLMNC